LFVLKNLPEEESDGTSLDIASSAHEEEPTPLAEK
tara:strand:- start:344 stop:448 length:105 start_codon:yes stop_codon:yes gene_type:complete